MQNVFFCTRGANSCDGLMSDYRRASFPGGYYFFTLVTYRRRRILTGEQSITCLRHAFEKVRAKRYFETVAVCLLPEHLHCIWRLPEGDADFSTRWSLIKKDFTMSFVNEGGEEFAQSSSRLGHRHRGIWQRRFWEHQIRDERDLQRHIDYVHYNPVKHGLVAQLEDWPWSTYHKWVESGHYGRVDLEAMQKRVNDIFVGE